jgi:Zn-dependent protease with chaperone function
MHPLINLSLKALAFLCAINIAKPVSAQESIFTPNTEDVSLLKKLFEKHETSFKQSLSSLPSTNKTDYENIYKERWNNIKSKFDNKEIYTNSAAQKWLDALVQEIVQTNPILKGQSFQCYFSRSGIPNASYIGEGIILINMGLFRRLKDESQASFVIAHEIAHFMLKHSENAINKYVTTINSREVQQQLRAIKGSEYRKREQLDKLVKGLTFSTRRHSRDHESEADSFAVEMIRNTRYDVSGALTTLALLDTIDAVQLNTTASLEKLFNAKGYPFQKRWIAKEEGLLGGHATITKDVELEDSLKTHPACSARIKALQPMVNRYLQSSGPKQNAVDPVFQELRKTSEYEIVVYAFDSDNYTRSLFHAIELMQQKPADPFLIAQIGKILNSSFAAQKAHQLGKYIELPSPDYRESYNMILQFFQNLNLEDYASISYHFLKQYEAQLKTYEPFKTAYSNSIQIAQQ